jgi:hypothetical protein
VAVRIYLQAERFVVDIQAKHYLCRNVVVLDTSDKNYFSFHSYLAFDYVTFEYSWNI